MSPQHFLGPATFDAEQIQKLLDAAGLGGQFTFSRTEAARLLGISLRKFDQRRSDGFGPSTVPGTTNRYSLLSILQSIAGLHRPHATRRIA